MGAIMIERRSTSRTNALRSVAIIQDGSGGMLHCTLLDLTRLGVRLSLGSTYRVADRFELTFDNGRTRRRCRVVWRTDTKLGVCFEQSDG